MLALATRTAVTRQVSTVITAAASSTMPTHPALQARASTPAPAGWTRAQSASYFFDAAHQTALTLKELLRVAPPGSEALGVRPNNDLLHDAMCSLVESVCPRMEDDYESRAFFNELLAMHLSGLSTAELQALSTFLKAAGFSGVVTESVWSDAVYDDFGFSNGPLATRQRTLMLPQDWQNLIDHVGNEVAASEKKLVPGSLPNVAESRFTRQLMAHATQVWAGADKSMTTLAEFTHDLCGALGLSDGPAEMRSGSIRSGASGVDWQGGTLVIDERTLQALKNDPDGRVFNSLLRDLLEAVMARRMFGPDASPLRLSPSNLMLLQRAIDEVAAQPPSMPTPALCEAAARLMAQSPRFGKVQIMPLTGVALGHAWIGNALSVVPDRTRPSVEIGKRYMRAGGRLEGEECSVREWPIRWLTAIENEDLYPPGHAWHIKVPVPALRLQQSATQVAQQWKEQKLPYRFIGTQPDMPSQGCRASVMQAVEQGMDDEARALFRHYNAGLAEPDSPTEVALRMNRFMQWIRQLSSIAATAASVSVSKHL